MFRDEDYEFPDISCSAQTVPPAQDERFGDFILKYGEGLEEQYAGRPESVFLPVNEMFGILYVPLDEMGPLEINSYTYASIPKCYTFMDVDALNTAGITRMQNHPYLKLQGDGVAIAVIDSGMERFSSGRKLNRRWHPKGRRSLFHQQMRTDMGQLWQGWQQEILFRQKISREQRRKHL